MSPTRLSLSFLALLFFPLALAAVACTRLARYDFEVDLSAYDLEPQLRQRNTHRRQPMPRALHPTSRFALN